RGLLQRPARGGVGAGRTKPPVLPRFTVAGGQVGRWRRDLGSTLARGRSGGRVAGLSLLCLLLLHLSAERNRGGFRAPRRVPGRRARWGALPDVLRQPERPPRRPPPRLERRRRRDDRAG